MAERFLEIDNTTGIIYAGDHTLEKTVGLSRLVDRNSVATITGGRRTSANMQDLAELTIDIPEPSDINRPLQLWNPNLTKNDVQGF